MLRRQKTTVLDGKPIVNIPDKVIRFHHVDFSSHERQLYDAIFQNGQVEFNKYLKKGTVNNHYVAILARILRLRQVCDHPHMIHDLSVQAATEGIAENDLLSRAKELTEEVVSRLREIDSFECPICLETAPNPTIFLPCGHNCCGECFQRLVDPTQIMQADEGGRPKCHSCRATLSSERITDYKHFCRVFCPENWSDEEYKGLRMDETKSDESDEDDDDVGDDDNDLGDFVVPDDVEDDYEPPRASGARPGGDSNSKGKRKGPAKPKLTLQELRKESRRNKAAKERYLRRLQKTFETSAKTDKILELLDEITATDPTEKILVFSQFTSFLDLVEVPLRQRQYKYQRYDGGMKMDERAEAVTRFMDDPTERVLLISLKAGNAGLNLSNASQVILLDPFWNPFIEDQAVDRAHRMPQKRVVHVHRVLVNDTIEDRIIELQNQKRDVIETALDETAGRNLSRLGIDDLKYLFGLGGQSRARQY
jgi:SNF2 family DNA or RNA helicase